VAVVWTGSFRPFHGVDDLLRAFAQVERSGADAQLVLVGSGQERALLERLATELGLRRVHWLGAVPFERMPAVLAAMDVGVIAGGLGRFHYSPVKLREYLASGLAVIAPSTGEMSRSYEDDALDLVEPGSPDHLAAALLQLIEDPERRSRLGRAGRSAVVASGSWDRVLDRLVAALASRPRGGAGRDGATASRSPYR
jgi:glycosyltransferase involved in cell wall biosynthesis